MQKSGTKIAVVRDQNCRSQGPKMQLSGTKNAIVRDQKTHLRGDPGTVEEDSLLRHGVVHSHPAKLKHIILPIKNETILGLGQFLF